MQNNAKISGVSSSIVSPVPTAQPANGNAPRPDTAPEEAARYRLVIEEGPRAGSYVYKTLDRVTGEVIRQFPREEVVELMRSPTYGAGAVIDTTA